MKNFGINIAKNYEKYQASKPAIDYLYYKVGNLFYERSDTRDKVYRTHHHITVENIPVVTLHEQGDDVIVTLNEVAWTVAGKLMHGHAFVHGRPIAGSEQVIENGMEALSKIASSIVDHVTKISRERLVFVNRLDREYQQNGFARAARNDRNRCLAKVQ